MSGPQAQAGAPLLYLYRLRAGAGDEYDRRHAEVWPEMLALIEEAGIEDYQIFRHEEIVVCRLRARHGFDHARAVTAASEVQQRWTASLAHLFEEIATKDGEPLWLSEVFRFAARPDS